MKGDLDVFPLLLKEGSGEVILISVVKIKQPRE
jgi:hypothetical protein